MGTSVIAAAARAERDVIDRLRLARALDPASGVAEPELPTLVAQRRFARLERAGVVRRATNGGVYLDEHAYIAWREARRRRLLVALVLALAVLAAVVALQASQPGAA